MSTPIRIAIVTYGQSLEKPGGNIFLTPRRPWLRATGPNAPLRNGEEAIELARFACEKTQYKSPAPIDALAAAYAEVGQFQPATVLARKAFDLAKASGQNELASDILARIALYQSAKPFRQKLIY